MFARTLADLERVEGKAGATATRLLNKQDGLGFQMTHATLPARQSQELCFTGHWECSLVLDGSGFLHEQVTGTRHVLEAGTLWLAGPEQAHRIEAQTDLTVMGFFNPELDGTSRPGLPRLSIVTPGDLEAMGRAKRAASGNSDLLRYLLAEDGMGFTISDCLMVQGCENRLWYRHHWEANFILTGEGSVEDLESGAMTELKPGVIYCVGPRDRHVVRTTTPMHLLSVFNPPLAGHEMHKDGGYPPSGPIPPGPSR